jgi:glycopeptide antibiotics resistance protein
MKRLFHIIIVLVPVLVLGYFYLGAHESWYRHTSSRRLLFLFISLMALYGAFFLDLVRARAQNNFQLVVRSSFYVYLFMVLTLTGYFILFREVSAHGWWDKMMVRIDHHDRVNLQLFKIFHIYKLSDIQIVGNLAMLFPLGIYLPFLYRRMSHFFIVVFVAFLISVTIELLQLATSYRSADVDDVFLNTLGAGAGFLFFALVKLAAGNNHSSSAALAQPG